MSPELAARMLATLRGLTCIFAAYICSGRLTTSISSTSELLSSMSLLALAGQVFKAGPVLPSRTAVSHGNRNFTLLCPSLQLSPDGPPAGS